MKSRDTAVYLVTAGFYSILGQVVILRELNVAFYGIELIYILSLAFWMTGTAAGAAAGRRLFIPGKNAVLLLFIVSAVFLIPEIIFIRGIRVIYGAVPGAYLPFAKQLIAILISLLPIGFLSGLLFQWTARRFISEGNSLAKAYSLESAGGIMGGLCSTIFLSVGLSNFLIAIICGICTLIVMIFYSFRPEQRAVKYLSLSAAFSLMVLFFSADQLDTLMTSWNHTSLIVSKDTPYSRVTITSTGEQVCLFEDDVLTYETETTAAEEFVQLASLQAAELNNVLVLGGGYAGIIQELLKLPVRRIDYVEINKDLVKMLRENLPQEMTVPMQDGRIRIIYDDPSKYLQHELSYDLILAAMPEPVSAQSNRFYTKEFFASCAGALDTNGILAFRIQSSENIWTTRLTQRNAAIYNALKCSFNKIIVLPGTTNIFLASVSGLSADPQFLSARFNERHPETRLVSSQYINYIFTNDRFNEIRRLLSGAPYAINSDYKPVCYRYTLSIWLSKFFPDLTFSDEVVPVMETYLFFIIVPVFFILFFLFFRKSSRAKNFMLVAAAGFSGMVLESLLILLYQNKNGMLYRDIGLLLMMFMAGLSAGSFLINKIFSRRRFSSRHLLISITIIAAFAMLNFMIYLFGRSAITGTLPVTALLLLLDGMFVSGIFAYAGLIKTAEQQNAVRPLYTADLLGGTIGSLAAVLFLIPVYGFFFTVILIALISLCSAVLLF